EGPDRHLYAVSYVGGAYGPGSFFRINLAGTELQLLHSFSGEGCNFPTGIPLLASDGHFYGTTQYGGRYDSGCLYPMTRDGQMTVLHEFGDRDLDDGAHPIAGLAEGSDGLLYGVTEYGGRHFAGTVFKANRQGWVQVLHSFHRDDARPDGQAPN